MMEVTRVNVVLNRDQSSKVKAFCKITFDDVFVVNNIVVMKDDRREDFYFINYPSKLLKNNGDRMSIAHPINQRFSKYVENRVLDEFERVINEAYSSNEDHVLTEEDRGS
jgi:DNA-binding cell septation regulator SpoVG